MLCIEYDLPGFAKQLARLCTPWDVFHAVRRTSGCSHCAVIASVFTEDNQNGCMNWAASGLDSAAMSDLSYR